MKTVCISCHKDIDIIQVKNGYVFTECPHCQVLLKLMIVSGKISCVETIESQEDD